MNLLICVDGLENGFKLSCVGLDSPWLDETGPFLEYMPYHIEENKNRSSLAPWRIQFYSKNPFCLSDLKSVSLAAGVEATWRMNRYESAYRDYTQRVNEYPQRPERKGRAERSPPKDSNSSAESNSIGRNNGRQQQHRGFTGDEDNYQPALQISSRELSDRSGGERSNPDYIVSNEALQPYQRYWIIAFRYTQVDRYLYTNKININTNQ